jgi:hypothetical protein
MAYLKNFPTGHYVEGGDNHFLGLCAECDAHYLSRKNLMQVQDLYNVGRISQDMYEAYVHVWRQYLPSRGNDNPYFPPADSAVARYADMIRAARGLS